MNNNFPTLSYLVTRDKKIIHNDKERLCKHSNCKHWSFNYCQCLYERECIKTQKKWLEEI